MSSITSSSNIRQEVQLYFNRSMLHCAKMVEKIIKPTNEPLEFTKTVILGSAISRTFEIMINLKVQKMNLYSSAIEKLQQQMKEPHQNIRSIQKCIQKYKQIASLAEIELLTVKKWEYDLKFHNELLDCFN